MLTLAQINKELQKKYPHVQVVRAKEGYFYLWSADDKTALWIAGFHDNSIPVYRVNHLSLENWLCNADDIINNRRNAHRDPTNANQGRWFDYQG